MDPRADEPRPSVWRIYAALLVTAGFVLAIDQLTKQMALDALSDGSIVQVIDGVLTFRLTLNPGGAFGIFQDAPGFFLVATLLIVTAILIGARKIDRLLWAGALGLVLGGGLGNLYDRVARDLDGRVVDFIDLQVWPVFNVADSAIVIGVIVILTAGLLEGRSPRAA